MVDSDGNAPSPAGCKPAVLTSITTSPFKVAATSVAISDLHWAETEASLTVEMDAGVGVAPTKIGL